MTLNQRKGYKTFSEVQQTGGSQFAPEQPDQQQSQAVQPQIVPQVEIPEPPTPVQRMRPPVGVQPPQHIAFQQPEMGPAPKRPPVRTPVPIEVPIEEPIGEGYTEIPFDDDVQRPETHQPPPQRRNVDVPVEQKPPSKKSNMWMWVGISVVVLGLILGGAYVIFAKSSGTSVGSQTAGVRRRMDLPPVNPAFKKVSSVKAW